MSSAQPRVFSFGHFILDEAKGKFMCGSQVVRVRPKSLAVLTALLSASLVVSKDDLLERVWGDAVVTEDSLVRCIHEIRRVLDDREMTLVRTVARRGYVFDAPLRVTPAEIVTPAMAGHAEGVSSARPCRGESISCRR
ncbi:MAG: winged helix-turn-helix domain-containing protein [Burkholderiaceae bacterium]